MVKRLFSFCNSASAIGLLIFANMPFNGNVEQKGRIPMGGSHLPYFKYHTINTFFISGNWSRNRLEGLKAVNFNIWLKMD